MSIQFVIKNHPEGWKIKYYFFLVLITAVTKPMIATSTLATILMISMSIGSCGSCFINRRKTPKSIVPAIDFFYAAPPLSRRFSYLNK